MTDGMMTAAGREWMPEEIFLLQRDWDDPRLSIKDIAAKYRINCESLRRNRSARKKLGLGRSRRSGGGNNNRGRIPVPQHAHPFVRKLYRIINAHRETAKDVSLKAGFNYRLISDWKHRVPRVDALEAAVNVLGYKLIIVPSDVDTRALESRSA